MWNLLSSRHGVAFNTSKSSQREPMNEIQIRFHTPPTRQPTRDYQHNILC